MNNKQTSDPKASLFSFDFTSKKSRKSVKKSENEETKKLKKPVSREHFTVNHEPKPKPAGHRRPKKTTVIESDTENENENEPKLKEPKLKEPTKLKEPKLKEPKLKETKLKEPTVEVTIDSNEDAFLSLKNSQITGNKVSIRVSDIQNEVSYIEPNNVVYKEDYPGVGSAVFDKIDNSVTGRLRITPRTVKPLEKTSDCRIIYWILSGEITVRSTTTIVINGSNCLYGKKLSAGSCLLIPPFTPYTLENRSMNVDAILGFVLMKSPETIGFLSGGV